MAGGFWKVVGGAFPVVLGGIAWYGLHHCFGVEWHLAAVNIFATGAIITIMAWAAMLYHRFWTGRAGCFWSQESPQRCY